MRAVVTGAAGFIGSHLVESLAADNVDVTAVDRRPMGGQQGSTALRTELSEPDHSVTEALRAVDVVFHLAGCPGVRDRLPDVRRRRYRDNVLATRQVLSRTPPHIPVVVTSSSSVYGGSAGVPFTEDMPVNPRGGYAESKLEVEYECHSRLRAGGRVVVVRPFTVAGERQRPDMALARWIDAALRGVRLPVFGNMCRTRDVTDVRDVVMALRGLAATDYDGVVNVGTGVAHSLRDMLDAVRTATERSLDIELLPVYDDDPDATLADPTRLTELTGLRPRTDLTALVRRQVGAVVHGSRATAGSVLVPIAPEGVSNDL